jgi:hypothetical protein
MTKTEARELYFAIMVNPTDAEFELIWREMRRKS